MPSHDAFLKEITANPEDLTPRLVYADWLDEQGDPRGEFIRVQCELARLDETDERYPDLLFRERELLAEHRLEWLKPLRPYIRSGTFRCGFVERAKMRFRAFLREGEKLAKLTPLRVVALTASGASTSMSELSDTKILKQLVGLEFFSFIRIPGFIATLMRLSKLPRLRRLKFGHCWIAPADQYRLLDSALCRNLTSLLLPNAQLDAGFFTALAESDLPLRQLDCSGNLWVPAQIPQLTKWRGLSRLATLNLNACGLERHEFQRLIDSPNWGAIRHLDVGSHQPMDLTALAKQQAFAQLTYLGVLGHPFNSKQVELLVESQFLTNLRRLEIALDNGAAASLDLFANWPGLRHLTHLRLFGRSVTPLELLFRSPYWNPKTLLSVSYPDTERLKWLRREYPEFRDVSVTTRSVPQGYLHDPVGEY